MIGREYDDELAQRIRDLEAERLRPVPPAPRLGKATERRRPQGERSKASFIPSIDTRFPTSDPQAATLTLDGSDPESDTAARRFALLHGNHGDDIERDD